MMRIDISRTDEAVGAALVSDVLRGDEVRCLGRRVWRMDTVGCGAGSLRRRWMPMSRDWTLSLVRRALDCEFSELPTSRRPAKPPIMRWL